MWERLIPADIERAKQCLVDARTAMLARHAAELAALDIDEREIDEFERRARAFAEKYMPTEGPSGQSAQSIVPSAEQIVPSFETVEESEAPATPPRPLTPAPHLGVHQQVSPNFGTFRRLVGR